MKLIIKKLKKMFISVINNKKIIPFSQSLFLISQQQKGKY